MSLVQIWIWIHGKYHGSGSSSSKMMRILWILIHNTDFEDFQASLVAFAPAGNRTGPQWSEAKLLTTTSLWRLTSDNCGRQASPHTLISLLLALARFCRKAFFVRKEWSGVVGTPREMELNPPTVPARLIHNFIISMKTKSHFPLVPA